MKTYHSSELRSMFLKFFKDHGHAVISSASVIPENDPTVLFTTAGMHPLVPYLMGAKHPAGNRLTDVQKCVRTGDIDDVGDFSHLTFFEMLGNWSLGDYFKEQMIPWSWEFLTSPEYLGLPKDRLAFSVFAGDADCPRDEESAQLWRNCGVADDHIFFLPKENNWWGPAGITGPCGPDTEMFIITDKEPCGPNCSPACSCGRYLEIWNDVFMQYNKKADGTFEPLEQKNVDTGMGLERTICVLNGKKSVYETDLFADILKKISELSGKEYGSDEMTTRAFRIIADHMRTATFIMGDDRGVSPSNVDQGYVLRRLIRRAVRYGMGIGMPEGFTGEVAKVIIEQYKDVYPELKRNEAFVLEQLSLEESRFARTLKQGNREFEKLVEKVQDGQIDGVSAFHLYDTYGFPVEMTEELARERGLTVDMDVTPLVRFVKQRGMKFYPAMIWVVSRVINAHEEFKLGWDQDGNLIRWDFVSPSYAHFHPEDGNFTKLVTPYMEDLPAFHARFLEDREKYRELRGVVEGQPTNHFDVSCLPWVRYRHFDVHVFDQGDFLAPVVTWGKYEAEGSRLVMPLTMNLSLIHI